MTRICYELRASQGEGKKLQENWDLRKERVCVWLEPCESEKRAGDELRLEDGSDHQVFWVPSMPAWVQLAPLLHMQNVLCLFTS